MKGISPVISVILLISIAVSTAALIAAWQGDFLSNYIDSLNRQSSLDLHCQSASASISSASFDCRSNCNENSTHQLTLGIRNTGDATIELKSAYMVKANGEVFEISLNQSIPAGSTRTLSVESTKSCTGLANSVIELSLPTQCSMLTPSLEGQNIQWINCQ